jgi:hypothetical protein
MILVSPSVRVWVWVIGLCVLVGEEISGAATPPAGIRLNEILASNQTGSRDDRGESSDWVELLNAGSKFVSLEGYRLTDDLSDLDKWGFSGQRVPAGGRLLIWMSGKEKGGDASDQSRSVAAAMPLGEVLIESGAQWKYLVQDPTEQAEIPARIPAGWTEIRFDDQAFRKGRAGLGYGDDDDATGLPPGTTVVLMRHEFVLPSRPASNSLILEMDYDDGFIAYLNGQRVAAANAPAEVTNFSAVSQGGHDAGVPERFDLSAHAGRLQAGKNVLALVGLNISASSSDLSCHPKLGLLPVVSHANFTLEKGGGALYLVAPDGTVTDQVLYPKQITDQSMGRSSANDDEWRYFLNPTPGIANGVGRLQSKPLEAPWFTPEAGAFDDEISVVARAVLPTGKVIRYTLDGTEPSGQSPVYRSPIQLGKTARLRAAVFDGSERCSAIESGTYLVGDRPELPVLAISMTTPNFHDVQLRPNVSGHAGERPGFLEYFDASGKRIMATGFGLRLHGGSSRGGGLQTKKSYRTYFRKRYGEGRLGGDIIPEAEVEDFDKLVLRASANDKATHGSSIRDQVVRDVHADMGGLVARGSWAVLQINSKHRGVYNITERLDEEFLGSHLGPGKYDVIKTGETLLSGTREGWDELREFVSSNDFSDDENYEELSRRVDLQNLTAYMAVNMCLLNFDWPNNNWYAARRVPDGKWIFLCWDAEWGLGYRHPGFGDAHYGIDMDPYAFMDSGGGYGGSLIRLIFLAVLDNPKYVAYYRRAVREYLDGPLSTENILRHVHRHRDAIAQDLAVEYRERGQSLNRWHEQIREVELFARNSPIYFEKHTDEYFSFRNSPGSNGRLGLIEGRDGRRHVIYRQADGRLGELSSTADGEDWTRSVIRVDGEFALAEGRPFVYSLKPGNRRILYRSQDGHLHELSAPGVGDEGLWGKRDLTSQLQLPIASGDPTAVVAKGALHIAYVDQSSRPWEVWLEPNGLWRSHPLPTSPRPASDVTIAAAASGLYVAYRTMFNVPCVQTVPWEAVSNGQRPWRHRLTQRVPCKGQPVGSDAGGTWRIIFRPIPDWPLREPFIFHWDNGRGYHEYSGSCDGLMQGMAARQRFQALELIGEPSTEAASDPIALADASGDQHFLAYVDAVGHLQEAHWIKPIGADSGQGEWRLTDLTKSAGAPLAEGEPAGLVSMSTSGRYYVYRGRDGNIHELNFDGRWGHRNLSAVVVD